MLLEEINIKLVLLGDGGVGKTALINSMLGKDIPNIYVPTIGSNIARKELKVKDFLLRIYLWDIGGQLSFNPINPVSYTNVDAAFLVFDLSQPKETFAELEKIYLPNLSKYSEDCMTFVIGNKLDLITNKTTLKSIVKKYSLESLPFILTSAKTKENVEEALDLLAYRYLKEWEKKYTSEKFKGLAEEYLKAVKWNKKDLESLFMNLTTVDKLTLKKKAVIKKVEVKPKDEVDEKEKSDEMLVLQHRLKILEEVKEKLKVSFDKNITTVQELILNLKKTPIDMLIDTVDSTSERLKQMKNDFEVSLESMLDLESGKVSEQDIKKKSKEDEAE
jgi:small GTP-binding protein